MKKSVIGVLSGLAVFSVSVLAYDVFSDKSVDTEWPTNMAPNLKKSEELISTPEPVLPKSEKSFIFSQRKNSQLTQSKKDDALSVMEQTSITQEDMLRMLENFGNPTEEALRWITKDQRHKEFELLFEKLFGDTLPKEARETIMESARLAWFRQDMLTLKYESGEVDMDRYLMGLEEVIRADIETLARELTDEQYMALLGEAKGERFPERDSESFVSTEGYAEMLSLFPALRNGERTEVSSSSDVYRVIPKETIDAVARISREEMRTQRELQHAFLAGDMEEDVFLLGLDSARQKASDEIDAILSPEQELFLYGQSDRWDAMMPEREKGNKNES